MDGNTRPTDRARPSRIVPIRFPASLWDDVVRSKALLERRIGHSLTHQEFLRSAIRDRVRSLEDTAA